MKKITGIYKITSPSNKIYIGQSVDIKKRVQHYKYFDCKSQTKLYNSLKKYGWDKHIFEIIHECNHDKLNELEVYYIHIYQCFNSKFGMNLRSGGNVSKCSDETKEKIRLAQKRCGNKPSFKGRKHTEESKLKQSVSHKLMSNETKEKMRLHQTNNPSKYWKDKQRSKTTKEKISTSLLGNIRSEESKRKQSISISGDNHWRRKQKNEKQAIGI